MQVLNEQGKAYFNFIKSIKSESTIKSYTYCIEKFLDHYEKNLDQKQSKISRKIGITLQIMVTMLAKKDKK